jgi:regulator of replication initiation timing
MKAKDMVKLTELLGKIMSELDDIKQMMKDSVMENVEFTEGEK